MNDTFELNGEEYEMNGNPSLRTVRKVQGMQMDMIRKHVSEEQIREMDSVDDESEIIGAIMDSGGMDALQDTMWEKSMLEPIQTISLASDEKFGSDDFDDYPALEFKDLQERAEEALGGSASDFFDLLGIGLSLNEEEMERRASKVQAQKET
jgi:hypothetical protein